MENNYFGYLKDKLDRFGIYTASLFPEHSCLTFALVRALEISGSIDSFYVLKLINEDEYNELRTIIKKIIGDLKPLFERRAKWTTERLEDYLGRDPSTYRVVINVYNDLLNRCFLGQNFDYIGVKKDG